MSQEDQDKTLIASVHDLRYFVALLRGISFNNRATVRASAAGLAIFVEEARSLLAVAYIFSGIFDEYIFNPEPPSGSAPESSQEEDSCAVFEIPLNTLTECLNVFGTATASNSASNASRFRKWGDNGEDDEEEHLNQGGSGRNNPDPARGSGNGRIDQYFGSDKGTGMRLTYAGPGHPVTLLVAEDANGPTATCEVTTFDPEPILELDFNETPCIMKVILKSSWLRDALSELDPSCERLTIICNPPPPPGRAALPSSQARLRLQAIGNFGSTEMDYPNDKEVLETCECAEQISFSYSFRHISRAQRALQSSTKTSLRINEEGLLSLQLIMPSPRFRDDGNSDGFIEFRVRVTSQAHAIPADDLLIVPAIG
ncbi:Rad1-domain-containing protein [Laetiporus sulphureus 93-53]|uniref:Rad1-domain-containing protein n=1 Tax=Laetiporus sulphureus 93-53 TaxID=1314785 RepID=A0A165HD62_9APHY|nr:Rad1-domain-containing protein [Laetiporus sulphureus 93-53]KZT11577.1 Rad1-domain-containing protein [Laetiporus sulphureus 93-53]